MKLLDLCCGAGGAAVGYHQAGFDEIVGVDIHPMPRYPFRFVLGDAIEFLAAHGRRFDLVHISAPCQGYSVTRHSQPGKVYPMLIEPARMILLELGVPYIIENVVHAPLLDPVMLCGTEFGLNAVDDDGTELWLQRHRLFESNLPLVGAGGCDHGDKVFGGVYGGGSSRRAGARGGYTPNARVRRDLMGMPWATRDEVAEAIPPAYTEFLGAQALRLLAE